MSFVLGAKARQIKGTHAVDAMGPKGKLCSEAQVNKLIAMALKKKEEDAESQKSSESEQKQKKKKKKEDEKSSSSSQGKHRKRKKKSKRSRESSSSSRSSDSGSEDDVNDYEVAGWIPDSWADKDTQLQRFELMRAAMARKRNVTLIKGELDTLQDLVVVGCEKSARKLRHIIGKRVIILLTKQEVSSNKFLECETYLRVKMDKPKKWAKVRAAALAKFREKRTDRDRDRGRGNGRGRGTDRGRGTGPRQDPKH